jgi:hypothetical protein
MTKKSFTQWNLGRVQPCYLPFSYVFVVEEIVDCKLCEADERTRQKLLMSILLSGWASRRIAY